MALPFRKGRFGHSVASHSYSPHGTPAGTFHSPHTTLPQVAAEPQRQKGISLADWLKLSTTFPHEFGLTAVEETPDGITVVGRSEIYEIFEGNCESVWRRIHDRRADYTDLAPGLYLGARAIERVHSVPLWIHEKATTQRRMSAKTTAVAAVQSRLLDACTLAEMSSPSPAKLLQVARQLAVFHQNAPKESAPRRARLLDSSWCSALPSEISAPALEAYAFARRQSIEERRVVQEIHGNLRARHVTFAKLSDRRNHTFLLNRAPGQERFGDPLEDLASLTLDLTGASAKKLEASYEKCTPGSIDQEAFRYYLVMEALDRACAFAEALARDRDAPGLIEKVRHNAFLALRASLGLTEPFLLVLDEYPPEEIDYVAQILDAPVLSLEDVCESSRRQELLPETIAERLARAAERELVSHPAVILRHELGDLEAWLEELELSHVSIQRALNGAINHAYGASDLRPEISMGILREIGLRGNWVKGKLG